MKKILVFGGTGFVGRHIVGKLLAKDHQILIVSRNSDHEGCFGRYVGQISHLSADITNESHMKKIIQSFKPDAIINAVGIIAESFGDQKFKSVHQQAQENLAKIAKQEGVKKLVVISALGVDHVDTAYQQTKMNGEKAIKTMMPGAVIIRPSLVFGEGDHFFEQFAFMSKVYPFLPLIDGGKTKFQPVYVGDIASGVAKFIDDDHLYDVASKTKWLAAVGPDVRSFKSLLEQMLVITNRKNRFLSIPSWMLYVPAMINEWTKINIVTREQLTMLKRDNILPEKTDDAYCTLTDLGIKLHSLDTILPKMLEKHVL